MSEIYEISSYFPLITRVSCDCTASVTEVNILIQYSIDLAILLRWVCLKMKLSGRCPCGYFFDTFNDTEVAIVEVKLHFARFHKSLLPFGITDSEALALLKKGKVHRKQNVSLSNFYHNKKKALIAQENTLVVPDS